MCGCVFVYMYPFVVEWVWQHPLVSRVSKTHFLQFRHASRGFGARRSVQRKVMEMLQIVNLEPFRGLNLTVSFTNEATYNIAREAGASYFSSAMCDVRNLMSFANVDKATTSYGKSVTCSVCEHTLGLEGNKEERTDKEAVVGCYHGGCDMCCHSSCLKDHFRSMNDDDDDDNEDTDTVMQGECPECQQIVQWSLLTQHDGHEKGKRKRKCAGRNGRIYRRLCVSSTHGNDNETESSGVVEAAINLDCHDGGFGGRMAEHVCNSEAPADIGDVQMCRYSRHEVDMIDLTEE